MSDSEQPDDSQKTEDPTPKRLEDAKKKGQVPLSRELNNWIMLLAGTVLIGTQGPRILNALREHLKTYIEQAHDLPGVPGGIAVVLGDSFWGILSILTLPLLMLIAAAIAGPLLQIGPMIAPEAIKPSLSKISPLQGAKRLFSMRSLVEFAKGVLKLIAIGLTSFILLRPFFSRVDRFVGMPMPMILDELMGLFLRLMIGVLIVLVIIAVIDVVFQRYQNYKQMRMTKQEVKDEFKQAEGDPHVKARLRQLRTERSRQRMMQNVPEADVVITNPTHFSIALKYQPEEMDAPVCIAKGQDELALRIREIARENDIVVYENAPLARVLFDTVDIDDVIPPEHYKAVAEVISYVFRLKGKIS